MKLYLPALLTALFPYSLLAIFHCLFSGFLMDTVFRNNALFCLAALAVCFLIALVSVIALCILGCRASVPPDRRALLVMGIKLIQIPAYAALFVLGALFLATIFTIPFTLFIVFWDVVTIILSGAVGAVFLRKNYCAGCLNHTEWIVHTVLQFVFCADVVSTVIVFRKLKQHL